MKKFLLKNALQFAVAIVVMFAVWWIAYFVEGNELLFPSPFACLKEAFFTLGERVFWVGIFHTLIRVAVAFVLAFFLAVVLAVSSYLYPPLSGFLAPIVSALRSMPVLAVSLILLVLLGADKTPIAVAFLSLFPMLYAGTSSALSAVDKNLVEMSKVYKVPLKKQIFFLYLPTAFPYLLREVSASLSFALKLVVSAEVLAGTFKSLGGMMETARIDQNMSALFALVIISFVCGMALEGIFALAVRLWKRRRSK